MLKLRRKFRSAIKWIGTVLSVLLVIVWAGSAWFHLSYSAWKATTINSYDVALELTDGQICLTWVPPLSGPYIRGLWKFGPKGIWMNWGFNSVTFHPGDPYIALPLWPLVLLTATPTAVIWGTDLRRQRRLARSQTHCLTCGYSRTGLPGGGTTCPECGTPLIAS